jgi:UPF0716 family protein affecting phage T7 exclusion
MTQEQYEAKTNLAALMDKGGNLAIAAAFICVVAAIALFVSGRTSDVWGILLTGLLNFLAGLLAWAFRSRLNRQLVQQDSK